MLPLAFEVLSEANLNISNKRLIIFIYVDLSYMKILYKVELYSQFPLTTRLKRRFSHARPGKNSMRFIEPPITNTNKGKDTSKRTVPQKIVNKQYLRNGMESLAKGKQPM